MTDVHNTELEMLRRLAADFSRKELTRDREQRDRYPLGPFFSDVLKKAHDAGFFAICLPERVGGSGRDMRALSAVLEEVSKSDASLSGIIFTSVLAQEIIVGAGAESLLKNASATHGRHTDALTAFPSFASPGQTPLELSAKKKGASFRLSGKAEYVALGNIAPQALVPALDKSKDHVSLFLVDTAGGGIDISGPVLSMGMRSCPAVDMTFDDTPARPVGEEGRAVDMFRGAADRMSIPLSAIALGIMKGSFDEALSYTRQRFQGGRQIIDWSEVRMILARMALRITVAELTTKSAADAFSGGASGWESAARAAAIYSTDSACEVTTDGIQLLGGNGYMADYGQEKRFRDARQLLALLGLLPMKRLSFIDGIIARGKM
jgi:alkylation response protein AidB-like acyl-CoA dehydrogenase